MRRKSRLKLCYVMLCRTVLSSDGSNGSRDENQNQNEKGEVEMRMRMRMRRERLR